MGRFDGRVVLVTGSGSGIGAATAARLAEEGASVVCADVNSEAAATTAKEIGDHAGWVACDVADPSSAAAAVAAALDAHGRLDVLANVAGIGRLDHTTDVTYDDWRRIIDVNLGGVFFMSQAAIPHLLETKGNIVSVASVSGIRGGAYQAAYSASKGGVISLTRSLAVEYTKRGLRVNCVCPGGVKTPIIKGFRVPDDADWDLITRMDLVPGHFADPSDIASVLAFLASDDARNISGEAVVADLGMTA
jgi:NAD(P)-dependent dehydrogenase (short-subunit alcohol dehydrogenase family)